MGWRRGAGWAEKQEISILRTHAWYVGERLCLVLSADVLCNILFCCVQWELVWVQDVMSAYLCLQIYLWESLDKKRMLFDFATTCCCLGLVYLNHTYERVISFSHVGLCSSLQVLMSSTVGRRGALLGLCVVIVQDAYNFTFCNWTYLQFDALCDCERGDLCGSSWSSRKAMSVQTTLLWIISREYGGAEVTAL